MIQKKKSGVRSQEPGVGIGGFTLIEVIITLVVLSIAAVGVLSVFTTGIQHSADPLIANQAISLAQGELDSVIGLKAAKGFSDSSLNTGINQTCKTNADMLPGFTCSLDICYVASGSLDTTSACATATSYKRAEVTITNTVSGKSVKAVTLLANY